jgi:predicted DNA-binding transcriptional regulator YafY
MARFNPSETTHGEKIIRLFAKLLFSRRKQGLIELANELECSKQSVSRMVDEISRSYSVEIRDITERGRKYYQIDRRVQDPALNLSITEVQSLMMCQAFAKHLLGSKIYNEAARALEKSETHISPQKRAERLHFESVLVGTIEYTEHNDHIQALIRGMNDLKVCKISYKAIEATRAKTFYIKPLKLFSHKNALYLHARMAKYPGRKYKAPAFDPLLAIHRIQKVELTERDFVYPEEYDFKKSFNRNFGLIKEDAFEVEVEFRGWAARYVAERVWSPDQKIAKGQGGSVRLTCAASSELEVISWVLSFGDAAKLIKPSHIIENMKKRLKAMNQLYSKRQ